MSISLHIYLRENYQPTTKLGALELVYILYRYVRPSRNHMLVYIHQSRQARNGIDQRADGILLTQRSESSLKNKTQKHLNSTKFVIARGRGGGC